MAVQKQFAAAMLATGPCQAVRMRNRAVAAAATKRRQLAAGACSYLPQLIALFQSTIWKPAPIPEKWCCSRQYQRNGAVVANTESIELIQVLQLWCAAVRHPVSAQNCWSDVARKEFIRKSIANKRLECEVPLLVPTPSSHE